MFQTEVVIAIIGVGVVTMTVIIMKTIKTTRVAKIAENFEAAAIESVTAAATTAAVLVPTL